MRRKGCVPTTTLKPAPPVAHAMRFRVSPEAAKAQLALAVLVAGADGHVDPAELDTIRERLADRLEGVSEPERDAVGADVLQRLEHDGLEPTLAHLAALLPSAIARHQAFQLAVDVAHADGRVDENEVKRVLRIGEALGLTREEARTALDGVRRPG